ncbi:hypothetical protein [Nocardia huaxiensis]|uniref:Excreted virulence factor EspC (Type VII ESX diderm) n=1 Tax=Nocardia huaxiensis TaxID=2755382 RepID=A0A7D6VEL8_9NOCA|nr:hypothetical protein [Nocardia huaxiensis]QLY30755.1 hypothetical protein H0264_37650 [Nocardia huaxiensis]UFS94250.1 hypothetical protein LPY97_26245 [Nocardia huaxiensis]
MTTSWLDMNPEGVRQQADSFQSAKDLLSGAAGSWKDMINPGGIGTNNDLGWNYATQAKALATGFTHVQTVVSNWAKACEAFENALRHSADTVQATNDQFAGDIAGISFNGTGELTIGGK